MRVAWVGLGKMGRPMAMSALDAGFTVIGYKRRPGELRDISEAGCLLTPDIAAAVVYADVVCVSLFSEEQIEQDLVEGGGLNAIPAGAILVIHITVRPDFVRAIARRRGDVELVDAGFSGGPADAQAARLSLMVGGEGKTLERLRPLFASYAGHIAHLGPLGSGMALKLINHLVYAANIAAARDALRLVRAQALDPVLVLTALLQSSGSSTALSVLGRGDDPEEMATAVGRYLRKDVPLALAGFPPDTHGVLRAATREFAD